MEMDCHLFFTHTPAQKVKGNAYDGNQREER